MAPLPAMFPAQPPPAMTPTPFPDAFPLADLPVRRADAAQATLKSLGQPPTPLNAAFFSRANVDALQDAIRARVADVLGLAIDRQSDTELLFLMRRTYLETANNWPADVPAEIARLNGRVLQEAVDAIAKNVLQFTTYAASRWARQPVAMATPADLAGSTLAPY